MRQGQVSRCVTPFNTPASAFFQQWVCESPQVLDPSVACMLLLFIAVIVVASSLLVLNTFGTLQGHGNCRPKILEEMRR